MKYELSVGGSTVVGHSPGGTKKIRSIVMRCQPDVPDDDLFALAYLFCASPKLLEACVELLDCVENGGCEVCMKSDRAKDLAKRAIEEALGQP